MFFFVDVLALARGYDRVYLGAMSKRRWNCEEGGREEKPFYFEGEPKARAQMTFMEHRWHAGGSATVYDVRNGVARGTGLVGDYCGKLTMQEP